MDRARMKTMGAGLLAVLAVVCLGWGLWQFFAADMPGDERAERLRRVQNDSRLRELMAQQREDRDEWTRRFAAAAPEARRQMLLDRDQERQTRWQEMRDRWRQEPPEGGENRWRERRAEAEQGEQGEPRERRGGWWGGSAEDRSRRMAQGNPQRQGMFQEMMRTRQDEGLGMPWGRGRGGGERGGEGR